MCEAIAQAWDLFTFIMAGPNFNTKVVSANAESYFIKPRMRNLFQTQFQIQTLYAINITFQHQKKSPNTKLTPISSHQKHLPSPKPP